MLQVGYQPALYEVPLIAPTTVPEARERVRDQRPLADCRRFPCLKEAFPQPDTSFGVFVAMPDWDVTGVVVVVDARLIGGSIYPASMPSQVDKHSILRHCGRQASDDYLVYFRDMPWPLVPWHVIQLAAGDLIILAPTHHPAVVSASLEDMLLSPEGWATIASISPPSPHTIYVLTDQEAYQCQLSDPATPSLELAVSEGIGVAPGSVTLLQTWPCLTDFCLHGVASREVYLAVPTEEGTDTDVDNWIVLDFRPLLGELVPTRVSGTTFDAQVSYRSLFLTPPFGFCLRAFGGQAVREDTRAVFHVCSGVTITFEYVPYERAVESAAPPAASPAREGRANAWIQQAAAGCAHTGPTGHAGAPSDRHRGVGARTLIQWLQAALQVVTAPSDRRGLPARRSRRRTGGRSCWHCLFLCCLTSHISPSVAVQTDYKAVVAASEPYSHRKLPTPCRSLKAGISVPEDRISTASATRQELVHSLPALPVEKVENVAIRASDILAVPDDVGPTLLEQAAQRADCSAFALASALVAVLVDHDTDRGPDRRPAQTAADSTMESTDVPLVLSLEAGICLTPHQVSSQDLFDILPHSRPVEECDWLDADLTQLLRDKHVPLELRTQFLNFGTWYSAGCPKATGLEIYTDGSAGTHDTDVRPCSWALSVWVTSGKDKYLLGWAAAQAAPLGTPYHVGECNDTALTAEYLGIIWGLVWSAEFGAQYSLPVCFRYDAIGAGGAVFGSSAAPHSPHSPYAGLARLATSLRHYVQTKNGLSHAHVKGHCGHLENELVDQLAKQIRRSQDDPWLKCLPLWAAKLAAHPMQEWAWATLPAHDIPTLFAFETEALRLQATDRSLPQPPLQGLSQCKYEPGILCFRLVCISVNVLTLRDPCIRGRPPARTGLYMTGRKAMLQRSLAEHEPILIGIQETRLFDSNCQPDPDYIVLHSAAAPSGHGGCALWISKKRPFAVQGSEKHYFQEKDATVVSFSPRHLAVSLTTQRFGIFVLVLHTPSLSNATWDEASAFWSARAADLARRPEGTDYVILADANARVGGIASRHVGHLDEEPEQDAGSLLHDFLVQTEAFLPSTFPDFHVGFSGTWKQPNGEWHRLDYVIVPCAWRNFAIRSQVLHNVELLQKREDHLPVLLDCTFARHLPGQVYWTSSKRTCRPAISHRETPKAVQAMEAVPSADWHMDTDSHYHQLVSHWQIAAAPFCSQTSRPIQQPYIQPATLELVDIRRALRQYLSAEAAELRRRRLALGFAAFALAARGLQFAPAAVDTLNFGLRDMDHSVARAIALLAWYTGSLRRSVADDRRRYLHGLAQAAAQHDFKNPRELYCAIRRAFPKARSARRGTFKPLPSLIKADGMPAITSTERAESWRQHFAAQEAGEIIAAEDYADKLAYLRHEPAPSVFDLHVVPAWGQTEQIVLGLRNQKAAGPDGISAELLKLHTASSARRLLPVLMKSAMRLREPTGWRGGDLVVLAKKASTVLRCEHFRSVLVSNLAGKVYHRCVRNSLKPHLLRMQPPLIGGVQEGLGVEFPALAIRTFAIQMHAIRRPWGVVFYDLAAAYYSVVRQSLVPNSDSDEGVLALFHSLQLPPQAAAELKQTPSSGCGTPATRGRRASCRGRSRSTYWVVVPSGGTYCPYAYS